MRSVARRIVGYGCALAALVLAIGSIAGCGDESSKPASGSDAGADEITIGIPPGAALFGPAQLALDQGYFQKHGVSGKVKVVLTPSAQLLSALAGGTVQFGIMSGPQPELGGLTGAMKWIGSWSVHPNVVLLAQRDIRSVKDLKGKKIAITAPGSLAMMLPSFSLRNAGIAARDVTFVPIASPAALFAALLNGQVDAEVSSQPGLGMLLAKRPSLHVIDDYKKKVFFQMAGVVGNASYIKANTTNTVKILKALSDAVATWWKQPDLAKAAIAKVTSSKDPNLLNVSYKDTLGVMLPKLSPVEEKTIRSDMSLARLVGSQQADPNKWAAVVDNSFITQAVPQSDTPGK